jgi:triosephosphate isomerase (TIM)
MFDHLKILAGNWKMHKTRAETRTFFSDFLKSLPARPRTKIVIAPSPVLLEAALDAAKGSPVEIYAQNIAWEEQGAFTGETSGLQLKDLGVPGSIIAHSERRTLFGESDESAGKRAAKALSLGLEVIYCVGETLQQREANETEAVLSKQITALVNQTSGFKNTREKVRLMIAYEPVWAIGTGRVASPQQVEKAHAFIHTLLEQKAAPCPVLYGGSVKASNFDELARLPGVNGALVGGASLAPTEFLGLLSILENQS